MSNRLHKAAQQALEALEMLTDCYDDSAVGFEIDAIAALRAALAEQPAGQEPLTDEEINLVLQKSPIKAGYGHLYNLCRAIEAEIWSKTCASNNLARLHEEIEELKYDREMLRKITSTLDAQERFLGGWDSIVQQAFARIDGDEAIMRKALEALEIGHAYAYQCAEIYHVEMRGYRQKRHEAMDAEVKQIAEALAALQGRLK